jgi:hypothetical protein
MTCVSSDLLALLQRAIDEKGMNQVLEATNVVLGTVKRWQDLKSVPAQYYFDLAKLLGEEINYSEFSYREKDQFFTPPQVAAYCIKIFNKKLVELGVDESYLNYIEPSAGDGSFCNLLPSNRTISLDVEPRGKNIFKQDFLDWLPNKFENNVVIGNPPFGLRGHTALKFMSHASFFADFVVFILPQLFESDGRGSPKKRISGLNLIHSEKIDTAFLDPEGKEIKVNTVFQIWSKKFKTEGQDMDLSQCRDNIRVYSLSDGGTPGTTRNKIWLEKCDIYLPSTCFGSNNMRLYKSFEDLPGRKGYGVVFLKNKEQSRDIFNDIDWSKASFKSTNSAFNLRTSIIEESYATRLLNKT